MRRFPRLVAAALLASSVVLLLACEGASGDDGVGGDLDGCSEPDPDACHPGCEPPACAEDELEVVSCAGEEGPCRDEPSTCGGCVRVAPCDPATPAAELDGAACDAGVGRCVLGEGEEAVAFECFFDQRWRCVDGEPCAYPCARPGLRFADTACPAAEQGVVCPQDYGAGTVTDLVCCDAVWIEGDGCPDAG